MTARSPDATATFAVPDGLPTATFAHRSVRPGGEFDEDTRVLLWWRLLELHIASIALWFILGGLVNFAGLDRPAGSEPPPWLAIAPAATLLEAVGGVIVLWRRPAWPLRRLRQVELVHFGTILLGVGIDRYVQLAAVPGPTTADRHLTIVYVGTVTQIGFMMLVTTYGTLIPNTARRGLAAIGLMVAVSFLSLLAAAAVNPQLAGYVPTLLAIGTAMLFVPTLAGVFVASRNHALRREAFEARRAAAEIGPYTLKGRLGEGGMGEVWLAEHRLLKRPCAVKFVRAELAANPGTAARFAREVQAVTGLTHFNTVRVYDYGRADDGAFYYVMEYLDGPTLQRLVRDRGPLPPGRAVYLLRQLCGALAEAHGAGLVHRDLKPGNVIVTRLGGAHDVAKLLDFGLVLDESAVGADDRLTHAGVVLGTPAYMPPEQAAGDPVDARGDVYALGAVAFFMLAGRPPFEGKSARQVMTAHLTQAAPVLDSAPPDLAAVVAKCLMKEPGERFQSARELDRAFAVCACASDWSAERAAAEATDATRLST